MPKAIIGIDLGTTTSCTAVIENGRPIMIPNRGGSRFTPSIVALTKDGIFSVGEMARQQALLNPENTIFSVKRLLGRKYDDPEIVRDRRVLPYKVVCANNGDAWVEIQGRQYNPAEITALILQQLKADAEAYLDERVTQAVITVPAYFNENQRQATSAAAKIAGLDVLRIINEPSATSLAYGLRSKYHQRILVYGLGGGSFSVSILQLGDGVFEVKSTNGDTSLGGDDFNQRILTWLANEFQKEQGIDLRQDRVALQRLKEAAENAKKELSSVMQVEISLPFLTTDASGPKHLNITLTRSRLEQLVGDLIEKTRHCVNKTLADAGVRPGDINEVVLVGDQTRMSSVRALVRNLFGHEPNQSVNPDEAVALGAAIYAGVLTGNVADVLLLDVTPFTLGIETTGGVFTPLIKRNTTIPTQNSILLSTEIDNQSRMLIPLLQGEQEVAKQNRLLGTFLIDGIVPAPHGVPQIEVTFDISADNIPQAFARDKGTGREQHITIGDSSGLSKEQIDRTVAPLGTPHEQLRRSPSSSKRGSKPPQNMPQPIPREISQMAQTSSLGKVLTDYKREPRVGPLVGGGFLLIFGLLLVIMAIGIALGDPNTISKNVPASLVLLIPALGLCMAVIYRLAQDGWLTNQPLHIYFCDQGFISAVKNHPPQVFRWNEIQVWRSVTRYYSYGVHEGTGYIYRVQRQDVKRVVLNHSFAQIKHLGEAICDQVTRTLRPQAIQSYHAGQTLHFGPLSLSQQGIVHGFFTLDWTDVASITVQKGFIVMMSRQSQFKWGRVAFSKIPNGFVFLALVDDILKSYGKRVES